MSVVDILLALVLPYITLHQCHFNTEPFSYKGEGHLQGGGTLCVPLRSFGDIIWKVFLKFNLTHGKSSSFFI